MAVVKKQNKITVVVAKKGAGKTVMAYATALLSDKKIFWITPIENSYFVVKDCDTLGFGNIKEHKLQSVFIVNNDKETFSSSLKKIQNISASRDDGVVLVVDELDYYCKSRVNNEEEIFKAINYGRHINMDMIFISRRFQDMPSTLTTNCDRVLLGMNSNIYNDLKYYRNFFKDEIIMRTSKIDVGTFVEINTLTQEYKIIRLSKDALSKILSKEA